MVVRGRVENGVVVPMDGVHLPEGEEVTLSVAPRETAEPHSVLDISPVSLGSVLRPMSIDDDVLGEMLAERL